MLQTPTVNGLKEAIAEKFELDYNKIGKVGSHSCLNVFVIFSRYSKSKNAVSLSIWMII